MLQLLSYLFYRYRAKVGKEDVSRINERFCDYNLKTITQRNAVQTQTVWIHAVSVGEFIACTDLIEKLVAMGFFVVCTTTTVTSAKIASNKLPFGAVHYFSPIPIRKYVKKFLSFWNPNYIFLTESEIWPAFLCEGGQFTKNIFLINARMSEKSFARWCYIKAYFEKLFLNVEYIFASSNNAAQRFRILLPNQQSKVITIGYTKFDIAMAIQKTVNQLTLQQDFIVFHDWIKKQNKQIITFGSMHKTEVQHMFQNILHLTQNNIIILAIRHFEAKYTIIAELKKTKVNYVEWTEYINEKDKNNFLMKKDPVVIIIDIIGALSFFYKISNIAVVCGSFVKGIGGHNPLESISLNIPTFIGEFYTKCRDIVEAAKSSGALVVTNNHNLIRDITMCNTNIITLNTQKFIQQNAGVTQKIIDIVFNKQTTNGV